MRTSKNRIVLRVRDWLEVEADLGPLVPVAVIAKLLGVGRRRAYRWAERGSVPVVRVYGQVFVPLRGCLKLCPDASGGKGVVMAPVGELTPAKLKGDS